jgi:acyl-CoA reductase-like NAD-dependent aldehyde dehydrogenase/quinol monooxygenase YgiN
LPHRSSSRSELAFFVVSLQVKPGHRDAFLAAIAENATRSFTDEPGCRYFDVTVDTADDHHFVFYELYADRAAIEAHRAAPHFALWRQAAAEHVVPGSQVNTITEQLLHHSAGSPLRRTERPAMTQTTNTPTIATVDPATGEVIAEYAAFDDARVESAIATAYAAAASWAATPLPKRLELLHALAEALRAGRDEYAALMSREMGKPITEAAGEVEKSAVTADYYVANAVRILADEHVEIDPGPDSAVRAWVGYEPLGVVYAVMPWNFPFWQVMRSAIPTLAAGNAVLLKHSPNVTGSALAIQEVIERAGFPQGLLTTLVVAEPDVPAVSERIIADDRVAAITLTGSNRAGAAVGAAAGRAVKKAVLELGGSDPFIVLDVQVERSVAQGATLLAGGHPVDGPGTYYQPTVLGDTRPGIAALDEETFGPVAAIASAGRDAELAELANASEYGLGLSIWTADIDRAVGLARSITSGAVFVNAVVASDPRLPFGGTKRSGHGRELATAGIREFTTIRTYWTTTSAIDRVEPDTRGE